MKFKKGHIPWNKGKKRSEETKKKLSKALQGKNHPFYGKHGTDSSNWKGGITPLSNLIRQSIETKLWREKVFKRDNYICQKCGSRCGNGKIVFLEAHHLKPFAQILDEFLSFYDQFSPIEDKETLLRLSFKWKDFWDISNGKTLCNDCHNLTKNRGY